MDHDNYKEVPIDLNTPFYTSPYVTEAKSAEEWKNFWSNDEIVEEYTHDSEGC
jgi:hypothetical protein